MPRSPHNQPGFTLIELMMAVTIIGLLASIAIPQFTRYIRRAKDVEAITNLGKIRDGAKTYYNNFEKIYNRNPFPFFGMVAPTTPGSLAACDTDGYPESSNSQITQSANWRPLHFYPQGKIRFRYTYSHFLGVFDFISADRYFRCELGAGNRVRYTIRLSLDPETGIVAKGPAQDFF